MTSVAVRSSVCGTNCNIEFCGHCKVYNYDYKCDCDELCIMVVLLALPVHTVFDDLDCILFLRSQRHLTVETESLFLGNFTSSQVETFV